MRATDEQNDLKYHGELLEGDVMAGTDRDSSVRDCRLPHSDSNSAPTHTATATPAVTALADTAIKHKKQAETMCVRSVEK